MYLKDLATRDLIHIQPGDSADKAMALMEEHNIHHLPVIRDGKPVGIVSDHDLLRAVGWLIARERTDVHDGAVVGPQIVADIMSSPVLTASPDDRIERAAQLIIREHIGAVVLVHNDQLVGLVAESDILRCFVDDNMQFADTKWRFEKLADNMSAQVFSLRSDDPLIRALKLMRDKLIRHIPIVDNGRLVGVISDRDVRQACFREQMEWLKDDEPPERQRTNLSDIMTAHPLKLHPDSTLSEAAGLMIEARIGALPVTDHGKLVGIITESDLMRAFVQADASAAARISDRPAGHLTRKVAK